MFATSVTVGQAKGIIDNSCFFKNQFTLRLPTKHLHSWSRPLCLSLSDSWQLEFYQLPLLTLQKQSRLVDDLDLFPVHFSEEDGPFLRH